MNPRPLLHHRSLFRRWIWVAALAVLAVGTVRSASSFWTPVGDMSRPGQDLQPVTLADGRVLIVSSNAATEVFDPTTGTFSATGPARFHHGNGTRAIRLLDGRVLVVGGEGALRKAETYDPAAGTFSETAGELLHAHAYHTITLLADGRVLVAGGRSGSADTSEHGVAELFDPAAGTFTLTGSMKCGREIHAAAPLADGRVLVVGGSIRTQPGFGVTTRSAEIYDPATGAFTPTGSMSFSRTSPQAVPLLDGTVLVFGWSGNAAEVYDPASGRFHEVGGTTVAHTGATATRLPDGRVLVTGGSIATGPVTTAISELYWPERRAFTRTAPMAQARQQHAAALLNDGRVLVVGGSFAGSLRSAEVFTLGDETEPLSIPAGPPVPGGRIEGRVLDETTGLPIAGVFVNVTGAAFALGKTNENGEYYTDGGLPAGSYFVTSSNTLGYVDEVYPSLPCAGCDPRVGTPVSLAEDSVRGAIDLRLDRGPQIRGRVTASDTGLGLRSVFVEILNASGRTVSRVLTDTSGDYLNGAGLPPGDYYARTSGTLHPYVNELHRDVPCAFDCDFRTGERITVTALAPAVDFQLEPGSVIQGIITDASSGARLPGITVELYDAAGRRLAGTISNPSVPSYGFRGLADGTYYVRTNNSLGYVNEIFDDVQCILGCSVTSGTARVVVGPATLTTDFALDRDIDDDGDGIFSTVDKNAATGADERGAFSSDFNDVLLGGSTTGTISDRGGWMVEVGDLTSNGVQAKLSGGGALPATIDTCASGSPERTILDAVALSCGAGGSTTAKAVFAAPVIQLRKPLTGAGIVVDLPTAHSATLGSPVSAGSQNIEAIGVRFVDATGATFGSFALDPAESVDASVSPAGAAQVRVIAGTVTFEVRGVVATLRAGQSQAFPPADSSPPVVTPQVTGTLGKGGWYVSDVHVSWSVGDPESAVTSTSGCGPTDVTGDTAGLTLTCSAVSAGGAATASVTIRRDKTGPVVGGLPAPGCRLWPPNHKLVKVATVSAADGLSGLSGAIAVSVTSSEPVGRKPDWVVHLLDDGHAAVFLRAEHRCRRTGRVYKMTAFVSDAAGNGTTATAMCTVPADRHRRK